VKLTEGQLWTRLNDLLVGRGVEVGEDLPGAELVVSEEGREVFRAALGRHARRDDDPAVVWIRPLVASTTTSANLPAFDLTIVRRRALEITAAHAAGDGLDLELVSGQRARVQPARGVELAVLQDFDTWMTTLTTAQRAAVDALDHD